MERAPGLSLEKKLEQHRKLLFTKRETGRPKSDKPFAKLSSKEKQAFGRAASEYDAVARNEHIDWNLSHWLPKRKKLQTEFVRKGLYYTDDREVNYVVSPRSGELTQIDLESFRPYKLSDGSKKNWVEAHLQEVDQTYQRIKDYWEEMKNI